MNELPKKSCLGERREKHIHKAQVRGELVMFSSSDLSRHRWECVGVDMYLYLAFSPTVLGEHENQYHRGWHCKEE